MQTPTEKETGRIEAFSDGVFAIAITLLILEIKVPNHNTVETSGLTAALLSLWPSYLAFIISFVTILVMWVNHHRIFSVVRRIDNTFLYLNGLLLLCATFVPFPTAVLAEYLLHSQGKVAASFYAGTFLAIALAFTALWRYASRDGKLLFPGAPREVVEGITKQYSFGPPLYLIAVLLSFFSVALSLGLCMLLAVFFGFQNRLSK
ncbi:TMEM175 family protein [Calothrix sp. NIES-2098]|uniref:TMEM175 family protein n=1 Tax=Calothrix sp. NIES-2098 TaxID=1954171 RepID=UPI000B5FCD08|nr:hypothetical protein NIES2098_07030 [Calothrix sp. NIES-2098]